MNVKINEPAIMQIVANGEEVIRFEQNGDIFVRGKLTENDKEVVEEFRCFLTNQGLLTV